MTAIPPIELEQKGSIGNDGKERLHVLNERMRDRAPRILLWETPIVQDHGQQPRGLMNYSGCIYDKGNRTWKLTFEKRSYRLVGVGVEKRSFQKGVDLIGMVQSPGGFSPCGSQIPAL